jgi:hypothetical protein
MLTPEATPPLPETPHATTGYNSAAQCVQIVKYPAPYTYSHPSLPWADSFTLDASAQNSQHDTDFDPHMLTNEATSTGKYTICWVVMQLTLCMKTREGY